MVVVRVFDSKGVKTVDINGSVVDDIPYDPIEDDVSIEPTGELEED